MLKILSKYEMVMKKILCSALLMIAQIGHAGVMEATASSETNEASILGFGSQKLSGFGINSQTNAQASLKTIIGADSSGAPFSSSQAISENTGISFGFAQTELKYSWSVQGGSAEVTDPILVHISTKGAISSRYSHISNPANSLSPNDTQAYAGVAFETNTPNGLTSTAYVRYYSPWYTLSDYPQTVATVEFDADSGRTIRTYSDSFNEVFDIWVTPNKENTIWMGTQAGYTPNNFYPLPLSWNTGKAPIEDTYSVYAYVDPIITIDPLYAQEYTLAVSYIPTVSVPEPSTLFLFALGLIGLGIKRIRKTA